MREIIQCISQNADGFMFGSRNREKSTFAEIMLVVDCMSYNPIFLAQGSKPTHTPPPSGILGVSTSCRFWYVFGLAGTEANVPTNLG